LKPRVEMKITKRQLRRIIREAVGGRAQPPAMTRSQIITKLFEDLKSDLKDMGIPVEGKITPTGAQPGFDVTAYIRPTSPMGPTQLEEMALVLEDVFRKNGVEARADMVSDNRVIFDTEDFFGGMTLGKQGAFRGKTVVYFTVRMEPPGLGPERYSLM
jgi:hypothetical protein